MLHGLQKYFDYITDENVQAGVSLSGGGGRATTGSCGAFSGGLMALSAKLSPCSQEIADAEMESYEDARCKFAEFRDWFIAEFGSVVCRDVQNRQLGRSFDLMDEQQLQAFRDFPAVKENCNIVSRKAALKVAEILSNSDAG